MSKDVLANLAVQSFCFRNIKGHDQLIAALKQCGIANLEMCGLHVDPIREKEADKIIGLYRKEGITFTSFGVHVFTEDEESNRKIFEFAALAGMTYITCHIQEGALGSVEKLAEEYGIKAAIHNHGRRHVHGSVEALRSLFRRTSSRIGLCLDTAWMIDMWENPVEVLKTFEKNLIGVHLKDFIYDRKGFPSDVMLGEGNLDLKAFLQQLTAMNYQGFYTLEYEGDPDAPIPSVKICKNNLEQVMNEILE